jgi:hypothetical protein
MSVNYIVNMESVMTLFRGKTAKVAPAPKEKTPSPKTPTLKEKTPSPKTPTPARKTAKRRPKGEPAGKKLSDSKIKRIVEGEKDMDNDWHKKPRPPIYYSQMEKNLKKFRYDRDQNLAEIRIYNWAKEYALPHSKENLSPV